MGTPHQKRAVIYCRVSTKEQVEEGNSLVSQERYCKEYAQKHGYEVAAIFIEQGESAKTADRTELKKLLSFCSLKKNGITAVIAYKIDRISRNTDDYSQIRIMLKRFKIEIKSTTEYFENTPSGKFMENMMANVAQFDNDVRAERSIGGMKEAVREGRYVWQAPYGYSNVRVNGKATIALNEYAPYVQRAFEYIARGDSTVAYVRTLLIQETSIGKSPFLQSKTRFYTLLRNPVYAGWINKFGELKRGSFPPIISEQLFNRVQEIISGKRLPANPRLINHPDFPLRNFITHPSGKALTGAWSTGRSKKYPYYKVHGHPVSIRKEKMEQLFVNWLNQFTITPDAFDEVHRQAQQFSRDAITSRKADSAAIEKKIDELKEKQATLIDKNLVGVISDAQYMEFNRKIDSRLYELQQALEAAKEDTIDYQRLLSLSREMLLNPGKVWLESNLECKSFLQWFYFPEGILFDGKESRTTKICSLFKLYQVHSSQFSRKVTLRFQKSNTHFHQIILPKDFNLDNKGYKATITLNSLKETGEKFAEFASSISHDQNETLKRTLIK